ncbi:MAG: O-antigen ligase family protein [Candidatus Berkelbacteria bacterium]|nr:O-antigen ligase family protein [Candidatus Berkelbacteria bacterium]
MNMLQKLSKIRFILVAILLAFLPFSSWLVSLTGIVEISLFRDIIVLISLAISLFLLKKQELKAPVLALVLAYCLWVMLSFFWREASDLQWLRGAHFAITPFAFLLVVWFAKFEKKEKEILYKIVFWAGMMVILFAILELLGVKLPMVMWGEGIGTLDSQHFVGQTGIERLQSILAGPNALGLYLLAIVSYVLGFGGPKNRWWLSAIIIFVLVLTFSRSALLGLFVALFVLIAMKVKTGKTNRKTLWLAISVSIVAVVLAVFLYRFDSVKQLIWHDSSSSLRLEQASRVWNSRAEIGLTGRGAGAAGLSSQNRLDSGPNRWTENTYLDVFEEFGYVGVVLYLVLLATALGLAVRNISTKDGRVALYILSGFITAGLFINFYTGQAGFFLLCLAIGMLNSKMEIEK